MDTKVKTTFFMLTIIGVVIVSFVPYFLYFGSFQISKQEDKWTFFFSYTQGIVGPITIIIGIYLTYRGLLSTLQQSLQAADSSKRMFELEIGNRFVEKQVELVDEYMNKQIFSIRSIQKGYTTEKEKVEYLFRDIHIVSKAEAMESKFFTDKECKISMDIGYYFVGFILKINTLIGYIEHFSNIHPTPNLMSKFYRDKYSGILSYFFFFNDYFVEYFSRFFPTEQVDAEVILDKIRRYFSIKKDAQ